MLKVEVLDKEGRPVPTAMNMIAFHISGDGRLLGVAMVIQTARRATKSQNGAFSMDSHR